MTRESRTKRISRRYLFRLTPAETELLRLMACGLGLVNIAAMLGRHVHDVRTRASTIYEKLGVRNQTQAARYAWQHGIISVDDAWATLKEHTR